MTCNHKYSIPKQLLQINECQYHDFYLRLKDNDLFKDFDLSIPIDTVGECLFHSNNTEWKLNNHFHKKFEELIKIHTINKSRFDFAEFVFIPDERNFFELKDVEISNSYSFNFIGAVFKSSVVFQNLKNTEANFNGATFDKGALIKNCFFNSLNLENTKFEGQFNFSHSEVKYESYFRKAKFLQLASFLNVTFSGDVHFNNTIFSVKRITEHQEPETSFNNVFFGMDVFFENTIIDCGIEFPKTTFNGIGEFFGTKFSNEFSTDFSGIFVNNRLILKGTNIDKKIFRHKVYFLIPKENIKGQIQFENANFYLIAEAHKRNLREMVYEDKVIIGNGCEKYLMSSDIKECVVSEDMQVFISEYTETFKNYFISEEGIILGIDIIERNKEKIVFRYFTDEKMTKEEFESKLGFAEENMWNLLIPKNQNIILNNDINSANQIRKMDTVINILSLLYKIGIRKSINSQDIEKLLDSIGFSKNLPFTPNIIHQHIVTKYTQTSLFSFNTNQNISLNDKN